MTYPVHAPSFDPGNWMPSNLHDNYSKTPQLNYSTAIPQYVNSSGMGDHLNYYPLDGFSQQYGNACLTVQ